MIYENLAVILPTTFGVMLAQSAVPIDNMNVFDKYGIPLGMVVIMMGALAYLERSRSRKEDSLAKERLEREKKAEDRQIKREQMESERRDLELEQRKLEREVYERNLDKKTQELQVHSAWLRGLYEDLLKEVMEDSNGPTL